MTAANPVQVAPVRATDPEVRALIDALTAELAGSGYTPEEMFGYSVERLVQAGVHLVGARVAGALTGIAGVEVEGDGFAELKRFYVVPAHRGTGVADALIAALSAYAAERGVRALRLETGDRQHARAALLRPARLPGCPAVRSRRRQRDLGLPATRPLNSDVGATAYAGSPVRSEVEA